MSGVRAAGVPGELTVNSSQSPKAENQESKHCASSPKASRFQSKEEERCFSSSAKATRQDSVSLRDGWPFQWIQAVSWQQSPPAPHMGQATCFTQSSDLNVSLIKKSPEKHLE